MFQVSDSCKKAKEVIFMTKKIVLFVCMGNRFRSRMAEEIFNKKAPKDYIAKSAGMTYQKYNDRSVKTALREIGIERSDRKPVKFSKKMADSASKIIVFKDVKIPSERTEMWPIDDCHALDLECKRKARKRIERLVENLVKSLE